MDEKTQRRLSDATHLALGMMVATRGVDDPAVYLLAAALAEAGSDSSYVRDICVRHIQAREFRDTGKTA